MNKKNSCEIQKYFLRVIFAKNFLAAALPDISSPELATKMLSANAILHPPASSRRLCLKD
jgi:hypothetical protein